VTLLFDGYKLEVFDTTVDIRTLNYVQQVEARAGRDIMATHFDLEAVVGSLRVDPRAICDSVMDQAVIGPFLPPTLPSSHPGQPRKMLTKRSLV
jgi:hypothetical protein